MMDETDFAVFRAQVRGDWECRTLTEVTARRSDLGERLAQLRAYSSLTQGQRGELERLDAEQVLLDEVLGDMTVAARNTQLAEISRAAQDPRNRTSGDGGGAPGAPAIISGRGDRTESPGEVIQRTGNPWRGEGGAPLDGETTEGFVARAHKAIEGLSGRLSDGGSEKLAGLLSIRPDPSGPYEVRTPDMIRRNAEFILAATSPYYESAFTHILKDPLAFRMGTGPLRWSADEREAFTQLELSRTALFESASGAYMLPLVLDDTILLTNAGSSNPWRRLCKTVTTTSNTWNGVTSAGITCALVCGGQRVLG